MVIAAVLAEGGGSEGVKRTSINRSYYAAFHSAHDSLEEASIINPPYGTPSKPLKKTPHRTVWNELERSPAYRHFGTTGIRLMSQRHEADYNDVSTLDMDKEATLAKRRANWIVNNARIKINDLRTP